MNYHKAMATGANTALTLEEQRASLLSFHDIFNDDMDIDFSIRRLARDEPD